MREKVAVALYSHEWGSPPPEGFERLSADDRAYWLAAAQAALDVVAHELITLLPQPE